MIYNELFLNEYILYIDSDIIKKNNIIDYLHNQIINSDYIFYFNKMWVKNYVVDLCILFKYKNN